jgi:hypothetical protein
VYNLGIISIFILLLVCRSDAKNYTFARERVTANFQFLEKKWIISNPFMCSRGAAVRAARTPLCFDGEGMGCQWRRLVSGLPGNFV